MPATKPMAASIAFHVVAKYSSRKPRCRDALRSAATPICISGDRRRLEFGISKDSLDELPAGRGKRIQHNLSLALRRGNSGRTQSSQVMGHEVLRPPRDPGEVADASFVCFR